jgi:hypothetical protein
MRIKILTWAGDISSTCVIVKTGTETWITAIVLSRTITISYWNIRLKRKSFFIYISLTYLSSITTCTGTWSPIRPLRPSSINYCTNKNISQRYFSFEKHLLGLPVITVIEGKNKTEILVAQKKKIFKTYRLHKE